MMFSERGRGMTDFFYIDGDYGPSNSQKQICYIKQCNVVWNSKNKGILIRFFTKEIGNLDTKIAKEKNLKTQKVFSRPIVVGAIFRQSVSENYPLFSQRQNIITSAQKNFAD